MSRIAVHNVSVNPEQPRSNIDEVDLNGLALSMDSSGLIQPITVDRVGKNKYQLVDGERRWRAAQLLGWTMIDAHIRNNGSRSDNLLLDAMVANIQKAGMSILDEARAYQKLMEVVGSGTKVAELVGVSVATVYNRIDLLKFNRQIQTWFDQRKLPFSPSVISALKNLPEEERMAVAVIAVRFKSRPASILKRCKKIMVDGAPAYDPVPRKKTEIEFEDGHFNILEFARPDTQGDLSDDVQDAALKTCRKCLLYEDASPANCKQCPLVEFLKKI